MTKPLQLFVLFIIVVSISFGIVRIRHQEHVVKEPTTIAKIAAGDVLICTQGSGSQVALHIRMMADPPYAVGTRFSQHSQGPLQKISLIDFYSSCRQGVLVIYKENDLYAINAIGRLSLGLK